MEGVRHQKMGRYHSFFCEKKGYVYTPWRAVYFEGGKRRSCMTKNARSPPILTRFEVKK
jgi:hypothetical protein